MGEAKFTLTHVELVGSNIPRHLPFSVEEEPGYEASMAVWSALSHGTRSV